MSTPNAVDSDFDPFDVNEDNPFDVDYCPEDEDLSSDDSEWHSVHTMEVDEAVTTENQGEIEVVPETSESEIEYQYPVMPPLNLNCLLMSEPDAESQQFGKGIAQRFGETTSQQGLTSEAAEAEMTSPSRSQIRKAFEKVSIAWDAKSGDKRNYRKPDYCLFCKGMYMSKISSHYLAVHRNEPKVKEILELPSGSKDRKRHLLLLQNEGNHLHNCEVLRNGCGEITVSRRPTDKDGSRPETYIPCSECKAWIFEKSLSNHSKSCPAGKSPDKNLLRNSRMLISPFISLDSDDADIEDLILNMKETTKHPGLRNVCKCDVLIKEFCRGLLHKLGPQDEQRRKDKDNIRTKLRAVGRLLISLNRKSMGEHGLSHYITAKHFMLVVNTVKDMSTHSPNLALTLGHYIKQICQIKQSLALQSEDDNMKKEASEFSLLFGAHWNNYVAAVSLRRLKLRTLNKTMKLPKTSEMVKLKDFLDSEIESSLGKQILSPKEWTHTAQAVMVRILLFNKRRVSEVEEMKALDITQVQNCSDNEEILSQMDITEKALVNRMSVIEVRGKSTRGLRKVFVILSEQMLKACQHLIGTRLHAGIPQSNEYLFARPSGSVLDGCQAMRDVSGRCPGLECPELIRTRLLRKYLATTIQLLDMTGDELKMVADHMGHSVAVHTDVYRLQSSLLEKTKVARALIALENGQLSKFAGRNLASCTLEELPVPIVEPYDVELTEATFQTEAQSDKDSENEGEYFGEDLTEHDISTVERGQKKLKRAMTCEGKGNDLPIALMKSHTRKKWDQDEEACLLAEFKDHIASKLNPSGTEIRQAQEKHECLKERSIAVIKSKLNNIILGKCKIGSSK